MSMSRVLSNISNGKQKELHNTLQYKEESVQSNQQQEQTCSSLGKKIGAKSERKNAMIKTTTCGQISDPSDDDCCDVDEMIVVSAQWQANTNKKESNQLSEDENFQVKCFEQHCKSNQKPMIKQKYSSEKDKKQKQQFNQSNLSINQTGNTFNQRGEYSTTRKMHQNQRQYSISQQKITCQTNDPENENDFNVAYKKLIKKLEREDGGTMLVPQIDMMKLKSQNPLNMDDIQNKIQQYQDKKRQKIQFLKETMEQKEVEECIFAPQLITKKKGEIGAGGVMENNRNIEQFLEDQQKYEELKKQKASERQEEQKKSMMSQILKNNYVNDKSRKILEQRQSRMGSAQRPDSVNFCPNSSNNNTNQQSNNNNSQTDRVVSQRRVAYKKGDQIQTSSVGTSSSNNQMFKPQIQQKSKDIIREKPVQDILYEDAIKRKAKQIIKQKEADKNNQENQINQTSLKYVLHKFNKEFNQCLNEIMRDDQNPLNQDYIDNNQVETDRQNLPSSINYLNLKQLMVKLGFMSESAANSDSSERILLYDMWKVLQVDEQSEKDEVRVDDLRVLIMAIIRLTDQKRVGVDLSNQEAKNKFQKSSKQELGCKDKKGRLCFSTDDIQIIYKNYDLLYVNRIKFQTKMQMSKKMSADIEQPSFKPQLSKESQEIAMKYRQKLATSINEDKIQTFEWLAASGNKDQWIKNAKQILEKEKMKECTFRPQIKSRQGSINQRVPLTAQYQQLSSTPNCMDNIVGSEGTSHFGLNQEDFQQHQTERANSKMRSRDLMPQTGDKFNDLYLLSKKMQKPTEKKDKTTEEIEFEKNKRECTFAPNCKRQPLPPSLQQELINQPPQQILEDKFVQKEIERMKKAREERERVKQFTQRGIILQSQNNVGQAISSSSGTKSASHKSQPKKVILGSNSGVKTLIKGSDQKENDPKKLSSGTKKIIKKDNLQKYQTKDHMFKEKTNNEVDDYRNSHYNEDLNLVKSRIKNNESPLLFIDINLGEDQAERIIVYEGDTAAQLAQNFCQKHSLDEETQQKLESQLSIQIRNVLSRIEEEQLESSKVCQ